jgi:signal transduction histidine kinase
MLAFENRLVCKDGSYRWIEWTATPVPRESVLYGVGRDVTERRQAESELRRLAGEQAARRRVATLVATGVSPAEVFSAVAEEVERLLDAQATAMGRLDPDGTMAIVASSGTARDELPVGTRLKLESELALTMVVRTGRSARVDGYSRASESVHLRAQRLGIRGAVAVPIMVEGSLWGSIAAGTDRDRFPADAEQRMAEFTDLVATAIANADSRAQLAASRRQIVAAADEARREIERNLHDGTQQRLVSLGLAVRAAEADVSPDRGALRVELSRIATGLMDAVTELREISRGIHPAILARAGLGPALRTLARRSAVPVDLDVRTDTRLPEPIEVAAYFVASEALANAAKHAQASHMEVSLATRNGSLCCRSATTASAERIPVRARDSSACKIASRRSAGRSGSIAGRAAERHSSSRLHSTPSRRDRNRQRDQVAVTPGRGGRVKRERQRRWRLPGRSANGSAEAGGRRLAGQWFRDQWREHRIE